MNGQEMCRDERERIHVGAVCEREAVMVGGGGRKEQGDVARTSDDLKRW